jgi:hypothetical protein
VVSSGMLGSQPTGFSSASLPIYYDGVLIDSADIEFYDGLPWVPKNLDRDRLSKVCIVTCT